MQKMFVAFEDEHVIGFGFQTPIAQTFFLVLLTEKSCPYLLSTVLPRTGNTMVEIDFWNQPHQVHIGGLLEGTHLRIDVVHTHPGNQIG